MGEVALYPKNRRHQLLSRVLDGKSQGDRGRAGIAPQQRPRTAASPNSCPPCPGMAPRRPRKEHRSDAGGPDAAIIRGSLGRIYMDSERRDVGDRRGMFERVAGARGGWDRGSQTSCCAGLSRSGGRLMEGMCVLATAGHVGPRRPARSWLPLRAE